MKPFHFSVIFLSLIVLVIAACTTEPAWKTLTFIHYPFHISVPSDWVIQESSTQFTISSPSQKNTLVFQTAPTQASFHELFNEGYDILVNRNQGVWVICSDATWFRCAAQENGSPSLYEFSVITLNDKEKVQEILQSFTR